MIKNVSELLKAPGLVPRSESSRLADIRRNRRLLNGDFSQLETDFPVNLFSRVACFYPALLFSETPEITVPDYPRFEAFFEETQDELLKQLLVASGDMISFGAGILATSPYSNFVFESFSPDNHFEIEDELTGQVTGDILIRVRGTHPDQKVDVYHYPHSGGASWNVYSFSGGSVGELLGSVEIPDRQGPQVIVMESGEGSIFSDMKSHVGALSNTLEQLGEIVENNASPNIVSSSGTFDENDSGKVELAKKGQHISVEEGDISPYFLSYSGPSQISEKVLEVNERMALSAASLSSLLFDPSQSASNLSGRALKRLLINTILKARFYSRINTRAIQSAAMILNENLRNSGEEFFPTMRKRDVEVVWTYESIFEDIAPPGDREPIENENEVN